ncbi:BON domain-containing protein [Aporhodopirellula aestuarii]|uniref:BON domain-containing protein n=1 Tax=Aporhodopirellula aestuarii TaxID=2950107 RepID=A0ABT0U6X4_9BACT|nr:BON domain-containing protein [Aporhodopirellula aestuarii]MCM2372158.1 BON domain-containing protein [Aporhodopirellula aestuarii]
MSTFAPLAPSSFTGAPANSPPATSPAKKLSDVEGIAQASANKRARILESDERSIRLDAAETPLAAGALALETAVSVLAQSAVAELRFLRVDENDAEIHLSGSVRSFYHKQLAQEAIRPIAAGRQVINRVDVCTNC